MTIVYTAILGVCDSLKPAPKGADRCVCFTDDPAHLIDPKGWEIIEWKPEQWKEADSRREAWRLRCIPHELFIEFASHLTGRAPGDVVSVWVDASFTVTNLPRLLRDSAGHELSGLKHHTRASCYHEGQEIARVGQADLDVLDRQLRPYQLEGFIPTGLTISCILVRANTPRVRAFNEAWLREIRQHPGDNTQLSIDYAAWKSGLSWHHLKGVRKDNPYAVHDHADHKKRRQPYRQAEAVKS